MATVKVKFRSSTVDVRKGVLYYQLIHDRVVRQLRSGCRLFSSEWDARGGAIRVASPDAERLRYLQEQEARIAEGLGRLQAAIDRFERSGRRYTADEIVAAFASGSEWMFSSFVSELVEQLKGSGRPRMGEAYVSARNSFLRFRKGCDIRFDEMDAALMAAYEEYLKRCGVSLNTSSFYMRNLRAIYNRAVEKGMTEQRYPFRHVYTGIGKTQKRAVPLKVIREIKALNLASDPSLDYVRDMFLFSFYTRGMSFVDMAFLRKRDLNNGVLVYRRKKTGQQLFIRWERCMQAIVEKYDTHATSYLLPIIRQAGADDRHQYQIASHFVNCKLKEIGRRLSLSVPLTMYVARHAWASIAHSKNIPLSVISEGMGHDSETTTQIYLASLDTAIVDRANRMILNSL